MPLPDEESAVDGIPFVVQRTKDAPGVVEQSEQERLEAAEFLVATRVQEQVRRRVARAAMDVRDHKRDELADAIHQPPAD